MLLAQADPNWSPERLWSLAETYGVPAATVLIIVLAALLASNWAGRVMRLSCEKARLDATLARFFAKLVRWIVLLIAGLFCLSKFGIETASFAVVLGSAGLAIGLALQGTLASFAAGVMLLIFRPFKVGDVVNIAGQIGKVDEIDLFATVLDSGDNRRFILPNSAVWGSNIENITHHPKRRIDVPVGVSYSADIDQTRSTLNEAAANTPGILTDPAPQIILLGLGASSIDWQVRVWCNTADYWTVREAAIRAVKQSLDAAGISIPFPQMDVHIDGAIRKD